MTLRKLLIAGSVLLSAFLIITLYFPIKYVSHKIYLGITIENSQKTADRLYASIYQVMRKGWTREEMLLFLGKMDSGTGQERIQVYRGPQVAAEYGAIEQPAIVGRVASAFAGGRSASETLDGTLYSLYPITMEAECLACHHKVAVGEVLGVIEIKQNISAETARFNRLMLLIIIPIAVFPIIGAIFLALFLHRRIASSISRFNQGVRNLTTVSDLSLLDTSVSDFPIEEFNVLNRETHILIEKLQKIAMDKEAFEFEIRLLEKLLITSEVVKDWKEHVKSLVLEINRIMEVPFIFAMFYNEERVYELEVFWEKRPTITTKRHFEEVIDACIYKEYPEMQRYSLDHHVASAIGTMTELDREAISLHTKKIFLDSPKIGGIVGMGLMTGNALDEAKLLVVEGVLTTMLNVIGSVKAIYRYTQKVEFYSTRDPQTGLFNLRFFRDLLEQEINRSERDDDRFSLLLLDLDNFKNINDNFGHTFGDCFLVQLATLIKETGRSGDIIARFGGDEFILLLPASEHAQAYSIGQRISATIADLRLDTPGGGTVGITASMGLVTFPDHGQSLADLILMSEKMVERAKLQGKNTVVYPLEDDLLELYKEKSEKTLFLKKALDENNIIPYFQPVYNFPKGAVEHYEVLMRIKTADGRVTPAHEFIEIAEEMGIISRMDILLMEKVFEKVRLENFTGKLFFNVSPRDLVYSEFMASVVRLVDAYQIPPERVVFEITEREAIRNLALVEKFVLNLKMKGFRFALDDFGSGFSSYFYLKKFTVDYIKIDGEFVRNMDTNEIDCAVVESVMVLARRIGVQVIAEFVETEPVFQMLAQMGIDCAQGYYLGRPSPDLSPSLPPGQETTKP
ncbi:MAG: hypothetical protein A2512_11535 [Deltaproteobacteria bacterium RIFOXYD12_FULL_56_24]|nr:MAG: hypothetical protein A2512_11535 [Deltaproteobacteria bacterium RIFOXYD12_FULL_56_24]